MLLVSFYTSVLGEILPATGFFLALVGSGVFLSSLQGRVAPPARPVCPRKTEFHGLNRNYPQQIVPHQTQKKNKLDSKLVWQVSHDRSVLLTDKLQQAGGRDPYEVKVELGLLLQCHDPQGKHTFSLHILIQWSILDTSDPCKCCSSIYQGPCVRARCTWRTSLASGRFFPSLFLARCIRRLQMKQQVMRNRS